MQLRDRIKRWWAPAKWRDEHAELSDGEDHALTEDERLETQSGREVRKGMCYGPYQEGQPLPSDDPGRD
jgi:hypothetical protein